MVWRKRKPTMKCTQRLLETTADCRVTQTLAKIPSPFIILTTGHVNHQNQLKGAPTTASAYPNSTWTLRRVPGYPQEIAMSPCVAIQHHFQKKF